MADTPDLTWIVVTHRSVNDLGVLIPSLRAALDELRQRSGFRVRVVIADAGSPDQTPQVAASLWPGVEVRVEPDNRGFGATANAAARSCRAPWLAVSNADLLIPEDGLAALPKILNDATHDVGAIGPVILDPDGQVDAWTGGATPTLAGLLTRRVAQPPASDTAVDWVTGACLFLRREAFERVGGFDERFFLYYEDADLALRLREGGWRTCRALELAVVHRRPHHRRARDRRLERVIAASRSRFFRRHRPAYEWGVLEALQGLRRLVDR